MTAKIHSTAIVSKRAKLGSNVIIGPFSIVGDDVTLGDNVTLVSHVSLTGKTSIGEGGILYPFVSMGHPPQDFKHKGGEVSIQIGKNCVFRENVNIHPGTDTGKPETRIGDNCYFMVGTHLAHEGQMGNNVVVSNGAQIGGNVTIGDYVVLGGLWLIVLCLRQKERLASVYVTLKGFTININLSKISLRLFAIKKIVLFACPP